MKWITSRQLIKDLPKRWKETYTCRGNWDSVHLASGIRDSKEAYDRILKLDLNTASIDDITKIIGNNGWCTTYCDECHSQKEVVLHLGNEPDYDSATVYICKECLDKIPPIPQEK